MGAPMPNPQERDDFLAAARRLGFDPDEFQFGWVTSRGQTSPDGSSYTLTHEVTVSRASNGLALKFVGGNGAHWAADAEAALSKGLFGAP